MRIDEKMFESMVKDFWNVDCLIRMLKELIFKNSWEMHDGDINTICEILAEKSEKLQNKIKELKTQI